MDYKTGCLFLIINVFVLGNLRRVTHCLSRMGKGMNSLATVLKTIIIHSGHGLFFFPRVYNKNFSKHMLRQGQKVLSWNKGWQKSLLVQWKNFALPPCSTALLSSPQGFTRENASLDDLQHSPCTAQGELSASSCPQLIPKLHLCCKAEFIFIPSSSSFKYYEE